MKTIKDFEEKDIKKDFIVDGLMKSNGIYCLLARPKVGKSFLALQLAKCIATKKEFLGMKTNFSPVLYISTEMDFSQLKSRVLQMECDFDETNFFFKEQEKGERKLNLMDLQYDLQTFANVYNGKFIIIDMMCGVDLNQGFDLNNYQDIGQYVIPTYRELCIQYGFTILLIHHLNKKNTSLGSTAIDGGVDGKIILIEDNNIKNKFKFKYESRDYIGLELTLKRNSNMELEVSQMEYEDLNYNLTLFLNYAIKKKEFNFTVSDITSELKLNITPTVFGRLLQSNLETLKKEGLTIEMKRTANQRLYSAKYEEPNMEII